MADENKEYVVIAEDGITIDEVTTVKGATIELNDEQASPLLEAGSIELKPEE